jgi:phosphopantothenoylcysteine decarboxylase/phosphopantothenate--cysteine ligase
MGYAVAEEAHARGAGVTLVSGPVSLPAPAGVELVQVRSAAEMGEAVLRLFPGTDIVVKAAAVADYRPAEPAAGKIKKGEGAKTLSLERTDDILARLGREKKGQVLVGFAAETDNLLENARGKLAGKNLDLVVANDVSRGVFGEDAATVHILRRTGETVTLRQQPKGAIARAILDLALEARRTRGEEAP